MKVKESLSYIFNHIYQSYVYIGSYLAEWMGKYQLTQKIQVTHSPYAPPTL